LLWSVGEFKRAKNLREESSRTKKDPRGGNFGLDPLPTTSTLPLLVIANISVELHPYDM